MEIKNIYPSYKKKKTGWQWFCSFCMWVFLFTSVVCIIINLLTLGKPWCLIVMFSMYMIWSMLLSPSIIEYNRISQFTKLFILTVIMLAIIEVFITPGWAIFVIPIVMFGGITFIGILFFSNFSNQKLNIFPLITFLIVSIIFSICGLSIKEVEIKWVFVVLLSESSILLISFFIIFKKRLLLEFRKRFSTK